MEKAYNLKSLILVSIAIFIVIGVSIAEPVQTDGDIVGNWIGTLKIPSVELRVVFRITKTEDGSFKAFTDSPDQQVFGIPVDEVVFENSNIRLEVKSAGGAYEGKLIDNTTIEGFLKQGGESMPLTLKKVDKVPSPPNRPQTPKKPYPYNEEEVTYESKPAGVTLAGTLTLPRSNGPFPVVLLITGSGPQDRDETALSHKPFLVLSDYLTRQGIAVLRVDDRGVGKSTGDFSQANTEDFAGDVLAGVEYLKSRKEIDPKNIGLIGHSQGAEIASMVAAQSQDVAFIVLMAGLGISSYDNLVLQDFLSAKQAGASDEETEWVRNWVKRFYAIPLEEKDDAVAKQKLLDLYAGIKEEDKHSAKWMGGITLNPDFAVRYRLSYDPPPSLKKVQCPVLAINGERDVQVPPKENLHGIEEALKASENQHYTIKELPNLNHLFQTVQPGGETDYGKIEETMSPVALKIISDWVSEQTIGKIGNDNLETKVDKIFSEWDKPDSPGCALAIIRDGKIVYERGYGIANLDSKAPITSTTLFDIGSISKQFTAACVLLLAESGKISLDDNIRKYIPEFPDYGNTITIKHLIYHTSGIRDYPWLMVLARMPFDDIDKDKKQEIINLISRQSKLYFKPGDDYYYSNSNYFLLGAIVERVTGMSLGEYAEKYIFEPLGMKNTFIYEDPSKAVENKAIGYVQQDPNGEYIIKPDRIFFGDGGVNTNVEDLFKWDQNFYENRIGGPNFNNTMMTCGKLNNGHNIKYAFGLEVDEYRGLKTVSFGGYTEGFVTHILRFPDQKFTVICLANLGTMHPNELSMNVADLYLADQLKPIKPNEPQPEPVKRTEITLDPKIYDAYAGSYRFDFGLLMNITKENDRLMVQAGKQPKIELFPESETNFFLKITDAQISFNKDENGKVTSLILHQMGQDMTAKRVGLDEAITPERLVEFTGDYYNDELQVTYSVILDKDQIFVRVPRASDDPLQHIDGDKFTMSKGDITFLRDDQSKIIGFTLDVNTERLSFKFTRKQ